MSSSDAGAVVGLSLDFIGGLLIFKGHTVVMVVVDRFSKGIHLGSLPSHHMAFNVVHLFMEIVGKLHGMPCSLVSDRDSLFISRFWQELFRLSDTKLRMNSAYNPQSVGQTEVINRVVEQYLRAFVHSRLTTWGRYFMWAEWSYKTSIHSETQMTPYEITFGKQPPTIPQYIVRTSNVDVVDEFLINRDEMFASL